MGGLNEISVYNNGAPYELKSIEFDAEKRSFKINGKELSDAISGFHLTCDFIICNLNHCSVTMEYKGRR